MTNVINHKLHGSPSQLDGAAVTVFMFDFTGRSEDEVSLKELAQVTQGGVHVVVQGVVTYTSPVEAFATGSTILISENRP